MKKEEIKEWLADAVETDNPPGTDYYGAELDEAEVEVARQRMEEALRTQERASQDAANLSAASHHPGSRETR
jgi:hypothetical protein